MRHPDDACIAQRVAAEQSPLIIAWDAYAAAVKIWQRTQGAADLDACVEPFDRFARLFCPSEADAMIADFRRDVAGAVAA